MINESFFEVIDTEEKAYWLGFIAADGCVRKRKRCNSWVFTLVQHQKEKDHLEKFRGAIEHKRDLYHFKNLCRVNFNSEKFCNDLISHGVVQKKTFVLKPPEIDNELVRHWIRGYFDGDGCINIRQDGKNKRIHISGTEEVCEFISSRIPFYCSVRKNKSVFCIRVNQQKAIEWIADYFYKDSNVFLERNNEKFFNYRR